MPTLTTLDSVKAYCNIGPADTTNDGFLLGLLRAEEARFLSRVGWCFTSQTVVRRERGNGACEWTLPEPVVTSVTSIEYADDVGDDTWDTVDADDYSLRTNTYGRTYIRYDATFGRDREYRITYVAGYADADIPADAQEMIARVVAIRYFQSPHANKGLLPHQVSKGLSSAAGGSSSDSFQFPHADYDAVVRRYRVIPV